MFKIIIKCLVSAIKQVYRYFVDSLVSSTVIKYHRDISLNSIVGLSCKSDAFMPVSGTTRSNQDSTSSSSSSAASSSRNLVPVRKQIECECYSCHRVIAASRLAPHLEKCIGLGRNSSRHVLTLCSYYCRFRVARKRLANFATIKSQSASSSPRLNTRISVSSATNDTDMSIADDQETVKSEDSEWRESRESRTPPSTTTKRRRNDVNNHGGSLPPSVQPSRHSARIRHR